MELLDWLHSLIRAPSLVRPFLNKQDGKKQRKTCGNLWLLYMSTHVHMHRYMCMNTYMRKVVGGQGKTIES